MNDDRYSSYGSAYPATGRSTSIKARLMMALVFAVIALISYWSSAERNPFTGEKQHVGGITAEQDVKLGLQAAPEMVDQFGGEIRQGPAYQLVNSVGNRLVEAIYGEYRSTAKDAPRYPFQFHLLADRKTINAFALPGGQVFITSGLLDKLETEGQLAGVLGHEIGHVLARHGAQHIAKAKLTEGLTGAAVMATYDPNNPNSQASTAVIQAVGQLVNMKYGRNDELQADKLGVKFMAMAGYDPHSMVGVMKILETAGPGGSQPEFMSTHPNPEHRIEKIEAAIKTEFPEGLPPGLKK